MSLRRLLTYAVPPLFLTALLFSVVLAPEDAFLRASQRIFYIHVAVAWTGMVAYFVSFVYAVRYLIRRTLRDDQLSAASAEVGTVLITAVLVSGSIWARVAWNTWWTWDPRLVTTAVLWFLYVGYLLVRSLIPRPEARALVASVLNIIAFLDVPVVYLSVHWWATIHPVIITDRGIALGSPLMVWAMILSAAAMLAFYVPILECLYLLRRNREELEALKAEIRG